MWIEEAGNINGEMAELQKRITGQHDANIQQTLHYLEEKNQDDVVVEWISPGGKVEGN